MSFQGHGGKTTELGAGLQLCEKPWSVLRWVTSTTNMPAWLLSTLDVKTSYPDMWMSQGRLKKKKVFYFALIKKGKKKKRKGNLHFHDEIQSLCPITVGNLSLDGYCSGKGQLQCKKVKGKICTKPFCDVLVKFEMNWVEGSTAAITAMTSYDLKPL